jgi:hypothetical protein
MEEKQKKTWGHVKEKGERNSFLQYNKALDSYNVFQCIGKHCSYPLVLVKLRALATYTLYAIPFLMFRENFKKNH